MLHCIYKDSKHYRSAQLRHKILRNAGFSVAIHEVNKEDFKNFEKLRINPFSYLEEDWKTIVYDDQTGKFFVNRIDDMTPSELPDYFRPRLERRLALEIALERAYSFGM